MLFRVAFLSTALVMLFTQRAFGLSCAHYSDSKTCFREALEIFGEFNTKQYQAGNCDDNIFKFVSTLKQEGFDVSKMNALFISRKPPIEENIASRGARNGPTTWRFHVVLQVDQSIFDFDFGDDGGVNPLEPYFLYMFEPFKDLTNVRLQVIDGESYIKIQPERSFQESRRPFKGSYPTYTVPGFLSHYYEPTSEVLAPGK